MIGIDVFGYVGGLGSGVLIGVALYYFTVRLFGRKAQ